LAARPLDVFMIAGEQSGDMLGAELIRALARLNPGTTFQGVGGFAMSKAGLPSLFPMADIAVMGFLPVIAHLPTLLRRIDETAKAVIAARPDVLVIIDSPDFTHRVARRVRKALPHLPIIDYVSPTVWAWRPGRAPAMRAYVDHVLALLPFEPQAHERLGGPACTYVGHPLIERLDDLLPSADDVRRRAAPPPMLVVLPGSRRSEIGNLLKLFGETVGLLVQDKPDLQIVLPTVAHVEAMVRVGVANWPIVPRIVMDEAEKFAAFRSARAALAASGTVTLELALAQVPTVVAYKVSKIEEVIARQLVTTDHIALPNIILGERLMPELIQSVATASALAMDVADIMQDGPSRQRQLDGLERLAAAMQLPGRQRPSEAAAQTILDVVSKRA
jgi:lipid-A-disaccharide synthase